MSDIEVIDKYSVLIRKFIDGGMSASDFSTEYMSVFSEEESEYSEETYYILQSLFAEADAYCEDPELRDERDINGEQLRDVAKGTLEELETRRKDLEE